jgi:ribonuclease HII
LVKAGEKATGFALHDSKKLTRSARERWYAWLVEQRATGNLSFAVGMSAAAIIDRRGIVPAIRTAMVSALRRALASAGPYTATPAQCDVRLDGALRAPAGFANQRTIIKGDETEPMISLASIAAKVERDRRMRAYALLHPAYGFDVHKGYGTRSHYAALRKVGTSVLHRASFLRRMR